MWDSLNNSNTLYYYIESYFLLYKRNISEFLQVNPKFVFWRIIAKTFEFVFSSNGEKWWSDSQSSSGDEVYVFMSSFSDTADTENTLKISLWFQCTYV